MLQLIILFLIFCEFNEVSNKPSSNVSNFRNFTELATKRAYLFLTSKNGIGLEVR